MLAHVSGDGAAARADLDEALVLLRRTQDQSNVAMTLLYRAQAALAQPDAGVARSCLAEAQDLVVRLGDTWLVPWVLNGWGDLAAVLGDADRAMRLGGAAEAQRATFGGLLPPVFAARLDRSLAAARSLLGTTAAAAAWAEGGSLALEEALACGARAPTRPAGSRRRPGGLSAREEQVAQLVASGLSNREIATKLVIAERTAEAHLEHMRNKLGVRTRAQIAAWAVEHRLTGRGSPPSA
jgi:non-specific serine/threonine protein kinase